MGDSLMVWVCSRALIAGTPLLLGTLGEICAERAGVMNLGVEGMMAVGAVAGFAAALSTGNPWLGLMGAIAAGIVVSAIHAFFTITLRANQIVSGLALTTLGLGLSGVIGKSYVGQLLPKPFSGIKIPFLSDIPIVGDVIFSRDPVFYLSILVGVLFWFVLYKTKPGIVIRSVGENPLASETMGINIVRVRYFCVIFGGAMAGMAGAYLSLSYNPAWIEGMVAGRGWIVVALTIFSLWNPLRAFVGAYLFGGIYAAQYLLQSRGFPPNLLLMLPYLATLLALLAGSFSAGRDRASAPAALGVPYEKGQR